MLGDSVLDFLFPPRCGGCGRPGGWICEACRRSARPVPIAHCRACGRVSAVGPCPMCAAGPGCPETMAAWFFLEGPIREVIHRIKYEDRPGLAGPLVAMGLEAGQLPPGVLVPVPLGRLRRRRRGYNQADVIARRIAALTGRRCVAGLWRVRETEAQVGRSGEERRRALEGAFAWKGPIPGEVLLVDDVVTTGATLLECARTARAAGVERVHALAVALG